MTHECWDEERQIEDERTSTVATQSDSVREYAENVGREHPESAWILDPRDVWTANPFYSGPPTCHPEDDGDLYETPEERAEKYGTDVQDERAADREWDFDPALYRGRY